MSNPFADHGIKHLSASSINLFVSSPGMWVMQKLLRRYGPAGAPAYRGTAAEAGIVHGLLNPDAPIAECQAISVQKFDQLAVLSSDHRREKERDAVPQIVATALPELRLYGIPDEVQAPIEVHLDGIEVPFIGFCDLGWTQHGIRMDLKSQLRLSSEISSGHARQIALYCHGSNTEGRIGYCAPKKMAAYRLEDQAAAIEQVRQIALRLRGFLSLSPDPLVLVNACVVDPESFYVSEPVTRALVREVYGI